MTPEHAAKFSARADQLERDMARITIGPHAALARQLVGMGWRRG